MESTLSGTDQPEILVIDLGGVDCFTFIDYIEAMRRSGSFDEFGENLRKVRYRAGHLSREDRNHFFTDWIESGRNFLSDVTATVGGSKALCVLKKLNVREDGSDFVPGIPPQEREIVYIPSGAADDSVLARLETGDYAGIYTPLSGLDVSHVGIIVRKENSMVFRHASSAEGQRKVVDQDLAGYLKGKPGFLVIRPK
jgi:hypothetical protein